MGSAFPQVLALLCPCTYMGVNTAVNCSTCAPGRVWTLLCTALPVDLVHLDRCEHCCALLYLWTQTGVNTAVYALCTWMGVNTAVHYSTCAPGWVWTLLSQERKQHRTEIFTCQSKRCPFLMWFPGPIAIYLTTVTEILADDNPDAGHGRFKIGKRGNRQGQCVNDSQHISQHGNLRKLL